MEIKLQQQPISLISPDSRNVEAVQSNFETLEVAFIKGWGLKERLFSTPGTHFSCHQNSPCTYVCICVYANLM